MHLRYHCQKALDCNFQDDESFELLPVASHDPYSFLYQCTDHESLLLLTHPKCEIVTIKICIFVNTS